MLSTRITQLRSTISIVRKGARIRENPHVTEMSAQGLAELRRAEEEAKKQVEAARQDRIARLKQAKAEAE